MTDTQEAGSSPHYACPACKGTILRVTSSPFGGPSFRCGECERPLLRRPPTKQLIYLDQMVVSNMAKALDPDREDGTGPELQFWRTVFAKLDRLLKLNLIACPSSHIHDRESKVHRLAKEIEAVYEHFSAGLRFHFSEQIHLHQLLHGFGQHLSGKPVSYLSIPRGRVLWGDLDAWLERIPLHLNIDSLDGASRTRVSRDRAHDSLAGLFLRWAEDPQGFEQRFENELLASSHVLLSEYERFIQAQDRLFAGDMSALDAVVNPPLMASIVPELVRRVSDQEKDEKRALEVVLQFLVSQDAYSAPYNWNSSLLMAALARKAEAGQKRVGSGTINDVVVLSTVAPYTDAIFTDDQMAGLLSEAPLTDRFQSSAVVFSNNSRDEFMDYLDQVETSAPSGHRQMVKAIYGPNWVAPFYDLIRYVRERDNR